MGAFMQMPLYCRSGGRGGGEKGERERRKGLWLGCHVDNFFLHVMYEVALVFSCIPYSGGFCNRCNGSGCCVSHCC